MQHFLNNIFFVWKVFGPNSGSKATQKVILTLTKYLDILVGEGDDGPVGPRKTLKKSPKLYHKMGPRSPGSLPYLNWLGDSNSP